MLNCSASLAMSTSLLESLPGKLDIKRHSPSILHLSSFFTSITIVNLGSRNEYLINMDVSVCFEENDCEFSHEVLVNAYLPKPLCNQKNGFTIPGNMPYMFCYFNVHTFGKVEGAYCLWLVCLFVLQLRNEFDFWNVHAHLHVNFA